MRCRLVKGCVNTIISLFTHPRVDPDPVEVPGKLLGDVRLSPGGQADQGDHVRRRRRRRVVERGLSRVRPPPQRHGQVVPELDHGVLPLAAVRLLPGGRAGRRGRPRRDGLGLAAVEDAVAVGAHGAPAPEAVGAAAVSAVAAPVGVGAVGVGTLGRAVAAARLAVHGDEGGDEVEPARTAATEG